MYLVFAGACHKNKAQYNTYEIRTDLFVVCKQITTITTQKSTEELISGSNRIRIPYDETRRIPELT